MTDTGVIVEPPRKKRRWIGWVIALVVLVALGIAAWFIGDRVARDYAEGYIRDQIVEKFPESDPRVTIGPGSVLAMVIAGSLDSVNIQMGQTAFGEISGDLTLDATGVPLDGAKPVAAIDVAFDIAEGDAQRIITNLDGLENAELSLADGEVALASSFDVFSLSVPLGITFTPSAADGALVLTPATVSVNNAELSLTDLASGPFGAIVTGIVKPQTVCVAGYIPAVLSLTDATVVGDSLDLRFTGSDIALARTDFTELGDCG